MAERFEIRLPGQVAEVIHTLQQAGHEAYAVGGCIRDSILGRKPNDWDITTSAKPQQVKELFKRTVDTGIEHGTVTVLMDKTGYEVTTYRIDGEYEDSRHPKDVTFTASLEEDLKRRDFTMNAMAYNETKGLVDLFDGIGDIRRKTVRCVGEPKQRFAEDALRMMRAVRFGAQLGYDIEEKTRDAIRALAGNLSRISAERIQVELVKLLVSGHPEKIRECHETGMTAVFFPEFDRMMETGQNNPHHCYSVGEHTIRGIMGVRPDKALRLAMLFHDAGKPRTKTTDEKGVDHFYGHAQESARIAHAVLHRLKFDNDTRIRVERLVRAHDTDIPCDKRGMRRALNRLGEDLFPDLLEVKGADMRAQSLYQRREKEEKLARLYELYHEVEAAAECVSLKDLAVNGGDLIDMGMKPGKELGVILKALLEEVIEEPSRNRREYLLKRAADRSLCLPDPADPAFCDSPSREK